MFKLTIETDNAAFAYDAGPEIARILRKLADYTERGMVDNDTINLRDYNGDKVGVAEYEP